VTTSDLATLLRSRTCLLLDFDGPVCDVFAGLPAAEVADALRQLLARITAAPPPPEATTTNDPLGVLRASRGPAAPVIEQALQAAELEAVTTARPTAGADALLQACADEGREVVIVSNNSAPAITAYLERHHLARYVTAVHGRHPGDPDLMKPAPYLLLAALHGASADPAAAVFVGDSVSDVQAGRAARVPVIGYANKPGKAGRLRAAGAHAVVEGIDLIAHTVRAVQPAQAGHEAPLSGDGSRATASSSTLSLPPFTGQVGCGVSGRRQVRDAGPRM